MEPKPVAQVLHSEETLKEIAEDLRAIASRVDEIRKRMRSTGLKEIGIDGEKGQVTGRTAIHGFVANGEQALRRALDELHLREVEKRSRR